MKLLAFKLLKWDVKLQQFMISLNKPFIRNTLQIITLSFKRCFVNKSQFMQTLMYMSIGNGAGSFSGGTTLVDGRAETAAPTNANLSSLNRPNCESSDRHQCLLTLTTYLGFYVHASLWNKVVIQHWVCFTASSIIITDIGYTVGWLVCL